MVGVIDSRTHSTQRVYHSPPRLNVAIPFGPRGLISAWLNAAAPSAAIVFPAPDECRLSVVSLRRAIVGDSMVECDVSHRQG